MLTDPLGNVGQVGRYVGDPIVLGLTTGSARVQLKPNTIYSLTVDADAFFKFGDVTVAASLASNPIYRAIEKPALTDDVNVYVACRTLSGSGNLFCSEISLK